MNWIERNWNWITKIQQQSNTTKTVQLHTRQWYGNNFVSRLSTPYCGSWGIADVGNTISKTVFHSYLEILVDGMFKAGTLWQTYYLRILWQTYYLRILWQSYYLRNTMTNVLSWKYYDKHFILGILWRSFILEY